MGPIGPLWKRNPGSFERNVGAVVASARFGGEDVATHYAVMGVCKFPPECGRGAIFAAELRPAGVGPPL